MMNCPNCFKPLDTSLTSCDRCGWQISPGMCIPRAEHERLMAEKDRLILAAYDDMAKRVAELTERKDAEIAEARNSALEEAASRCDAEADRCDEAHRGGSKQYVQNCNALEFELRERAAAIRAMKRK